jgi:hypothetical protein
MARGGRLELSNREVADTEVDAPPEAIGAEFRPGVDFPVGALGGPSLAMYASPKLFLITQI